MSRLVTTCAFFVPFTIALAGCVAAPEGTSEKHKAHASTARTPAWNKYYVAGSRIPRALDPQGQPLTGSNVVTITDEALRESSGILLGDKLSGGYPR